MNDDQRFLFDLQGYLVLEGVLAPDEVQPLVDDMSRHGVDSPDDGTIAQRFGNFLSWGERWRNLIDHPTLLPVLSELLGERFRIDHAYGMAMRADDRPDREPGDLHHEAAMFHHGCYYVTHGNRMHNGLIVVSWALTDAPPESGGFICVPGSHKAIYPMPPRFRDVHDNPLMKQVPLKAGDVLIFTEALTHGTLAWKNRQNERRAVLLKYCPHYMQWAQRTMPDHRIEGLTERQRLILQGPSVAGRPSVTRTE